jgi:ComF family protein
VIFFKTAARGLSDVIFPPICVHCRGLVEAGVYRHLCARCAAGIDFVRPPHCSTCGHPFAGAVEGGRQCPHCVGLDPAFRAGCAAVVLRGPARSLLIELKYHRGRHVMEDIEAIFCRSAGPLEFARGAVLVPVPLHSRKLRERGYNQSELLARALARAAGGGARVELPLRRIEDTASQTAFGRRARRINLKNAFALAPRAALNVCRRHVLVDDVFTTGSTINSCAIALRGAGCLNLDVVTFGHG